MHAHVPLHEIYELSPVTDPNTAYDATRWTLHEWRWAQYVAVLAAELMLRQSGSGVHRVMDVREVIQGRHLVQGREQHYDEFSTLFDSVVQSFERIASTLQQPFSQIIEEDQVHFLTRKKRFGFSELDADLGRLWSLSAVRW